MAILDFLRAVLALSVTLGLIGLAAWALRRYAPDLMARLQGRRGRERRLEIVETLVLDPSRRLLLVRVGGGGAPDPARRRPRAQPAEPSDR